jgi:hypothetical protein
MITKGECILTEDEHKLLEKLMSNPKLFNKLINEFKENEFMKNFHRNALELNDAELYKLYGD